MTTPSPPPGAAHDVESPPPAAQQQPSVVFTGNQPPRHPQSDVIANKLVTLQLFLCATFIGGGLLEVFDVFFRDSPGWVRVVAYFSIAVGVVAVWFYLAWSITTFVAWVRRCRPDEARQPLLYAARARILSLALDPIEFATVVPRDSHGGDVEAPRGEQMRKRGVSSSSKAVASGECMSASNKKAAKVQTFYTATHMQQQQRARV